MLRKVRATRYVTPLREGGSLPAIVEADDLGLYVLKFRGAGQGPLALVAELVGGEIGRALGLNVPEIVLVEVDEILGRNEPDEEIRDLLRASAGLNLALDYLPGSVMFDPAAGDRAAPKLAADAIWFDAFITNVDRTARNPNLLNWHRRLFFIDHGAAMYFHHHWPETLDAARTPFKPIADHVLLPWADSIVEADTRMNGRLNRSVLQAVVDMIPDGWATAARTAYVEYFVERLKHSKIFATEAERARTAIV